jgi:hypothetical protein
MVICGSYIFEFSVRKEIKKKGYIKGDGRRKGNGTIMSRNNCQNFEN